MATSTVSNRVVEAIQDTLTTHLKDYLPGTKTGGLSFHFVPEEINAAQCPAVGIFDAGSMKLEESCRGRDALDNVLPGYVLREYSLDLQVFIKGRKGEDTQAEMNRWRDGIEACLEDEYDLGGIACDIRTEGSEPSIEWEEKSALMRVGVIRAKVLVWNMQGETVIVSDS